MTCFGPELRRIYALCIIIIIFRWKKKIRKTAALRRLQRRDCKGNIIPARATGPPCKCKAECFERVEPELQFHVLASFNSLANKCQQDQYLSGLVISEEPTWVGTRGCGGKFTPSNHGRKKVTYKYFIPTGKLI